MRVADGWQDYELLDATGGERLERWGSAVLIRPDPQVVWKSPPLSPLWNRADAVYHRSDKGGGHWQQNRPLPQKWRIGWGPLQLVVSPTGFKHTGVFPEQAVNWAFLQEHIRQAKRELQILNLFAYTGGATLAAASAGAKVCHVDASKGIVSWARENAERSGLSGRPVRWIVDDCQKFVEREIRRGVRYDGIILDPPSYGRGPGGEVWQLEERIYPLLQLLCGVLSDEPSFVMLSSYTAGLSAQVMQYLLSVTAGRRFGGRVEAEEIGLPVTESGLILPCGSTAIWTA